MIYRDEYLVLNLCSHLNYAVFFNDAFSLVCFIASVFCSCIYEVLLYFSVFNFMLYDSMTGPFTEQIFFFNTAMIESTTVSFLLHFSPLVHISQ